MGLLDFARNIGRKLFNREEDAAGKIREHIEEENPGIENMEVEFNNGVVTITGDTSDPAALEKAILMAGNVEGVETVDVSGVTAPEQTAKVEYYEIVRGDSLSKIAKRYYGDAMQYPKIFEANREVIKDPDQIFPGQKIRIPMD